MTNQSQEVAPKLSKVTSLSLEKQRFVLYSETNIADLTSPVLLVCLQSQKKQ